MLIFSHTDISDERFEQLRERRRLQAKRSFVVETESENLSNNVYNYCKQFGDINAAIAFTPRNGKNFVLVEYNSDDGFKEALKNVAFKSNAVQWPMQFLKLRSSKLQNHTGQSVDVPVTKSYTYTPTNTVSLLQEAADINEQIDLLYQQTRITDLSVRLRFLGTFQIERIINDFLGKIMPKAQILPFGSTMNGFGKMSSDLDIALRFDQNETMCGSNDIDAPLVFHGKDIGAEEKILPGRRIKCIAAAIEYCYPGAEKINAIHRAKVPIVGFFDANIHCSVDLSITNP